VNLLTSPFSHEIKESIHFYWKDLAKGSPGLGAELHFEQILLAGTFAADRKRLRLEDIEADQKIRVSA
jgi:hypothetical protein